MINLGTRLRTLFGTTALTDAQNQLLTAEDNGKLTAKQLQTARTIQTNLASTTAASFNGTANITPGVSGVLPVANGGNNNVIGATNSPIESITSLDQWKAVLSKIPNNSTYEFISNLSSGVLTGSNAPTGWTRFVIRRHDGSNNCQVSAYPWIDGTVRLALVSSVYAGTFAWTLNSIQLKTVNGMSVMGTGDIVYPYRIDTQIYQQRLLIKSEDRAMLGYGHYMISGQSNSYRGSNTGVQDVNYKNSHGLAFSGRTYNNGGMAGFTGVMHVNNNAWASGDGPNESWWWMMGSSWSSWESGDHIIKSSVIRMG